MGNHNASRFIESYIWETNASPTQKDRDSHDDKTDVIKCAQLPWAIDWRNEVPYISLISLMTLTYGMELF